VIGSQQIVVLETVERIHSFFMLSPLLPRDRLCPPYSPKHLQDQHSSWGKELGESTLKPTLKTFYIPRSMLSIGRYKKHEMDTVYSLFQVLSGL
jgi:hypothetical protein